MATVPFYSSDDLWECLPHIPPKYAAYFSNYPSETITQDRTQAEKAFAQYFQPPESDQDQAELIIAHGTLIRYFICRVLQIEPETVELKVTPKGEPAAKTGANRGSDGRERKRAAAVLE